MNSIRVTGRRLESPHSKPFEEGIIVERLGVWAQDPEYEKDARKILMFLAETLPPGTLAALEWDKDGIAGELRMARMIVKSLTARCAAQAELLGKCAENGKVSREDVLLIISECQTAAGIKP